MAGFWRKVADAVSAVREVIAGKPVITLGLSDNPSIAAQIAGTADKKAREYKSAMRQLQRMRKAEAVGKPIQLKPQTAEALKKAGLAIVEQKPDVAKRYAREQAAAERREVAAAGPAARALARAERDLAKLSDDPGTKVVISYQTSKGETKTLGRKGGIRTEAINDSGVGLLSFAAAQASDQGYGLDEDDIVDISIEDYEEWS